ncbi:MAG: hypothetical protein HPY52_16840 [Firmicutes bacterium]|nr:hypothetical protein [Bacillota bacterium]
MEQVAQMGWGEKLKRWWYNQLIMNRVKVVAYLLTILAVFAMVGLIILALRFTS